MCPTRGRVLETHRALGITPAPYGERPYDRPVSRITRWAPYGVAGLFAASGTLHLLRPRVFTPLIPPALPAPTGIVYASGVAELACAAGLARTARWAGPASAVLLVGILPGNLQMALDATAAARRRRTP